MSGSGGNNATTGDATAQPVLFEIDQQADAAAVGIGQQQVSYFQSALETEDFSGVWVWDDGSVVDWG